MFAKIIGKTRREYIGIEKDGGNIDQGTLNWVVQQEYIYSFKC